MNLVVALPNVLALLQIRICVVFKRRKAWADSCRNLTNSLSFWLNPGVCWLYPGTFSNPSQISTRRGMLSFDIFLPGSADMPMRFLFSCETLTVLWRCETPLSRSRNQSEAPLRKRKLPRPMGRLRRPGVSTERRNDQLKYDARVGTGSHG